MHVLYNAQADGIHYFTNYSGKWKSYDVVIPWRKPVDMSQKIPLLLDLDFKASQFSFSSGNIQIDSKNYSLEGLRAYVENGVYESLSNESVYTPSTSMWERIKSRVSAWFP